MLKLSQIDVYILYWILSKKKENVLIEHIIKCAIIECTKKKIKKQQLNKNVLLLNHEIGHRR